MIQKYSAYHTVAIFVIFTALSIFGVGEGVSYTHKDFESTLGKFLFGALILFMVVPVAINTLSMWWHMLTNGKWLWFVAVIFIAFGATAPYYFLVYRNE
ncbi:hypothetical protein MIB92_14840 [Aestuariirhabdus sp. Z084]|uniref:hypothetical protein n=1 Tax=Aestuariirhabdus haliotis TaxID=2918751 RepID=UPI00201B3B34|nr:hypothetical protein [Aestuariirhabdus haliotis]MCL6416936.1 hypothetical protein [Aestuariirhabdus haliotis]MCL6420961.1 hypothetical protein [Aestuariirhabdus haliotis]